MYFDLILFQPVKEIGRGGAVLKLQAGKVGPVLVEHSVAAWRVVTLSGAVNVRVVGVVNLRKQRISFPFQCGELFFFAGRSLLRLYAGSSGVGKALVEKGWWWLAVRSGLACGPLRFGACGCRRG